MSVESGDPSEPGKQDSFVVTPEDRVPELEPQASVENMPG